MTRRGVGQFFEGVINDLTPLAKKVAARLEENHRAELWPGNRLEAEGTKTEARLTRHERARSRGRRAEPLDVTDDDIEDAASMAGEYLTDL